MKIMSNISITSQITDTEEENVAKQIVNQCIDMGVAFIKTDLFGFFVYKDPFYDDMRPDRMSVAPRKFSRIGSRLSKENSPIIWDQLEEKEDKDEKKRFSLKSIRIRTTLHGRLEKLLTSHDSDISLYSQQYSFVDSLQRLSESSNESSRRSTFGDIIFRQKTKQSEQEQLWNYAMSDSSTVTDSSEDIANLQTEEIDLLKNIVYDLPTIQNFDLNTTVNAICAFVTLWKVAPTTRFAVLKHIPMTSSVLGDTYRVTIAFSQPTKKCPNPLAVAHVYFNINYSFVMPNNYPVMITYEFETYKHKYWVVSKRNMRSITFQNYFIESILQAKLSFYVQIFETTHGPLNQKMQELSVDEEYEMFSRQHEINIRSAGSTYSEPKFPDDESCNSVKNQKSILINTLNDMRSGTVTSQKKPLKTQFINSETVDEVDSEMEHELEN